MVFLKPVLFVISLTVSISKVTAYYCNHNLCGDEQYCCGDNLCCDYVYSLWYFWVGVVFLILVLSACGGFFRYCYDNNHYVVLHNFAVFPSEVKAEENRSSSVNDQEAVLTLGGNYSTVPMNKSLLPVMADVENVIAAVPDTFKDGIRFQAAKTTSKAKHPRQPQFHAKLWMDADIPPPYPENTFHGTGMSLSAQGPPPPYTESTQSTSKVKDMSRPLYH